MQQPVRVFFDNGLLLPHRPDLRSPPLTRGSNLASIFREAKYYHQARAGHLRHHLQLTLPVRGTRACRSAQSHQYLHVPQISDRKQSCLEAHSRSYPYRIARIDPTRSKNMGTVLTFHLIFSNKRSELSPYVISIIYP